MVDLLEGGEWNGARPGIVWRDIECPQKVGVERMWKALGVGETEGGELGVWVAICGSDQIFPAIDAETVEAAEEFLGSAFNDFTKSRSGLHLHGAQAFVSAADIPEEVAGRLEGDIGCCEIDSLHAEMEFVIDSRNAGKALGGEIGIEKVFRSLRLDGNQIGGNFFGGELGWPD